MSVLVATDFSGCSRTAVRLAAALARRRGARLSIIHAAEPLEIDPPPSPSKGPEWERPMVAAAEAAVGREAEALRAEGLTVEARVAMGPAVEVIREAMRAPGVELVVIGTHGRKGAARFFVGSVAEAIARSAPCPVLVTPEQAPELGRWEGREPLRLVVGLDGSSTTDTVTSWAAAFAAQKPRDLSLVRVYWPAEEALRFGLDDPWGGTGPRGGELMRLVERGVRRAADASGEKAHWRIQLRIASRDAAEVFAEEGALAAADALVVGVPKHRSSRWAALVPNAVLRAAPCPVFCVPEGASASRRALPPVRSVLLAIDLSDASKDVVPPAYSLLKGSGGRVELCTVHAVGPVNLPEVPPGPPLDDHERARLTSGLHDLVPEEAEDFGITTNVHVVEGRFAAEAILAAAERLDVDVVVVGSHGRTGLKRAVLGSVAEEVARRSPRPVLIVSGRARRAQA